MQEIGSSFTMVKTALCRFLLLPQREEMQTRCPESHQRNSEARMYGAENEHFIAVSRIFVSRIMSPKEIRLTTGDADRA